MSAQLFANAEELINISALSPALVAGEQRVVLSSPEIDNTGGNRRNSIRVTMQYKDIVPADVLGSFRIGAVLEYKDDNGIWHPTSAYQFNPIRKSTQALERVFVMQPDILTIETGVDDIIYPMDREQARISRSQGKLPDAQLRVCVIVLDYQPGGAADLDEFKVSGSVERYDV